MSLEIELNYVSDKIETLDEIIHHHSGRKERLCIEYVKNATHEKQILERIKELLIMNNY